MNRSTKIFAASSEWAELHLFMAPAGRQAGRLLRRSIHRLVMMASIIKIIVPEERFVRKIE